MTTTGDSDRWGVAMEHLKCAFKDESTVSNIALTSLSSCDDHVGDVVIENESTQFHEKNNPPQSNQQQQQQQQLQHKKSTAPAVTMVKTGLMNIDEEYSFHSEVPGGDDKYEPEYIKTTYYEEDDFPGIIDVSSIQSDNDPGVFDVDVSLSHDEHMPFFLQEKDRMHLLLDDSLGDPDDDLSGSARTGSTTDGGSLLFNVWNEDYDGNPDPVVMDKLLKAKHLPKRLDPYVLHQIERAKIVSQLQDMDDISSDGSCNVMCSRFFLPRHCVDDGDVSSDDDSIVDTVINFSMNDKNLAEEASYASADASIEIADLIHKKPKQAKSKYVIPKDGEYIPGAAPKDLVLMLPKKDPEIDTSKSMELTNPHLPVQYAVVEGDYDSGSETSLDRRSKVTYCEKEMEFTLQRYDSTPNRIAELVIKGMKSGTMDIPETLEEYDSEELVQREPPRDLSEVAIKERRETIDDDAIEEDRSVLSPEEIEESLRERDAYLAQKLEEEIEAAALKKQGVLSKVIDIFNNKQGCLVTSVPSVEQYEVDNDDDVQIEIPGGNFFEEESPLLTSSSSESSNMLNPADENACPNEEMEAHVVNRDLSPTHKASGNPEFPNESVPLDSVNKGNANENTPQEAGIIDIGDDDDFEVTQEEEDVEGASGCDMFIFSCNGYRNVVAEGPTEVVNNNAKSADDIVDKAVKDTDKVVDTVLEKNEEVVEDKDEVVEAPANSNDDVVKDEIKDEVVDTPIITNDEVVTDEIKDEVVNAPIITNDELVKGSELLETSDELTEGRNEDTIDVTVEDSDMIVSAITTESERHTNQVADAIVDAIVASEMIKESEDNDEKSEVSDEENNGEFGSSRDENISSNPAVPDEDNEDLKRTAQVIQEKEIPSAEAPIINRTVLKSLGEKLAKDNKPKAKRRLLEIANCCSAVNTSLQSEEDMRKVVDSLIEGSIDSSTSESTGAREAEEIVIGVPVEGVKFISPYSDFGMIIEPRHFESLQNSSAIPRSDTGSRTSELSEEPFLDSTQDNVANTTMQDRDMILNVTCCEDSVEAETAQSIPEEDAAVDTTSQYKDMILNVTQSEESVVSSTMNENTQEVQSILKEVTIESEEGLDERSNVSDNELTIMDAIQGGVSSVKDDSQVIRNEVSFENEDDSNETSTEVVIPEFAAEGIQEFDQQLIKNQILPVDSGFDSSFERSRTVDFDLTEAKTYPASNVQDSFLVRINSSEINTSLSRDLSGSVGHEVTIKDELSQLKQSMAQNSSKLGQRASRRKARTERLKLLDSISDRSQAAVRAFWQ